MVNLYELAEPDERKLSSINPQRETTLQSELIVGRVECPKTTHGDAPQRETNNIITTFFTKFVLCSITDKNLTLNLR